LKRWSELNRSALTAPTAYTSLTRQHSPFPHREDINGRFVLWEGDISLLSADCITNTTNERLNDSNAVSNRIIKRAGASLLEELKAIKGEHESRKSRRPTHSFCLLQFAEPVR
jgi:hypothetical protein